MTAKRATPSVRLRRVLTTSRSVTFEIVNGHPYRSPTPHAARLEGRAVWSGCENVFSLRGLVPGRRYTLKLQTAGGRTTQSFRTRAETAALSVVSFGAIGDGVADDTAAIQAAIMSCPDGGVVVLPAGRWLSAPLFLKSNVDLLLERDARLIGHTDIARWPVLPGMVRAPGGGEQVLGTWEGEAADMHASLLTGIEVENVTIHGEGVIDGNASLETWWSRPKTPFRGWRPRTVFFVRSKNVAMEGVTVRNSPSWTVHPFRSRELTFANLKVEAPFDSPNTDGINPDSCQDVTITGVHFSTGDDCISIKSGKISLAKKDPVATRRVRISNCLMENGHGAVVLGSEISGGIYDVEARDCLFVGTDRGLRLKTRRGRGKLAVVDGVKLRNIHMERVGVPFVINSFYWCDPDGKEFWIGDRNKRPVDDGTPTLRNVSIKNVVCDGTTVSAGFVLGLPERPVQGISIDNYRVRFDPQAKPGEPDMAAGIEMVAREGFRLHNVRKLSLKRIDIEGADGPVMIRENAT
jgi:polygalacturonase